MEVESARMARSCHRLANRRSTRQWGSRAGDVTGRAKYPRDHGMWGRRMCGSGAPLALALAALCTGLAARAAAQPPSKPVAPRLDLFVGGHYVLGLGEVCQRDFDVDACTSG